MADRVLEARPNSFSVFTHGPNNDPLVLPFHTPKPSANASSASSSSSTTKGRPRVVLRASTVTAMKECRAHTAEAAIVSAATNGSLNNAARAVVTVVAIFKKIDTGVTVRRQSTGFFVSPTRVVCTYSALCPPGEHQVLASLSIILYNDGSEVGPTREYLVSLLDVARDIDGMIVGRDISYSGSAWPQPNDIAFLATDRVPHFDTDFTTSATRAATQASTSTSDVNTPASSIFKPLYHSHYLLPPSSAQLTSQYVVALGYPEWSLTHDGFPPRADALPVADPSSAAINEDSDDDNNEDNDDDQEDDDELAEYKTSNATNAIAGDTVTAKELRRLRQQQYRQLVRGARDAPLVLASFHRDYIKRLQFGGADAVLRNRSATSNGSSDSKESKAAATSARPTTQPTANGVAAKKGSRKSTPEARIAQAMTSSDLSLVNVANDRLKMKRPLAVALLRRLHRAIFHQYRGMVASGGSILSLDRTQAGGSRATDTKVILSRSLSFTTCSMSRGMAGSPIIPTDHTNRFLGIALGSTANQRANDLLSAYHPAFVRGYRLWVLPSFDRSHDAMISRNGDKSVMAASQQQIDDDDVQFLSDDDITDPIGDPSNATTDATTATNVKGKKKGPEKADAKTNGKSSGATPTSTAASGGGARGKGLHRTFKHVPAEALAFVVSSKLLATAAAAAEKNERKKLPKKSMDARQAKKTASGSSGAEQVPCAKVSRWHVRAEKRQYRRDRKRKIRASAKGTTGEKKAKTSADGIDATASDDNGAEHDDSASDVEASD